jgi:hypothetical protein
MCVWVARTDCTEVQHREHSIQIQMVSKIKDRSFLTIFNLPKSKNITSEYKMYLSKIPSQPLPLESEPFLTFWPTREEGNKRSNVFDVDDDDSARSLKKQRTQLSPSPTLELDKDDLKAPVNVPASKEGLTCYRDNDVLSGRGGGTNVHPGNRDFRDLINMHRKTYLQAKKNDKPAISRAIVRKIRENNGRFLKKNEKAGLWFEIGDDASREKTSQALRQRAPEIRKLLFNTPEPQLLFSTEHRQQGMFMGRGMSHNMINQSLGQGMNMMNGMADTSPNGMMNPALFQNMVTSNNGLGAPQANQGYTQMYSAPLVSGNVNNICSI